MSTDNTPGLFEIKLNEEGTKFILKFVRIIRYGILFSCLIWTIRIIEELIRIFEHHDYSFMPSWVRVYFTIYPYHSIVHAAIIFILLYYYWKTGDLLKKAIDNTDETSFNSSFRMLYKYAVWSMISIAIGLIISVYDFIVLIYRHSI